MGASVRGAIDLVRLGRELSGLRGEPEPQPGDATFADAAIAALSGRLRLDEGADLTPEAIVLELIERLKPAEETEPPGKARAGGRCRRRRGRPRTERRRRTGGRQGARPAHAASRPARRARTAASSRSRPRSAGSTRRRSTISCGPTRTPPSHCSPTSARRPIRSCARRPGGSPRACSSAPAGSGSDRSRGYRRLSPGRAGGEGDLDLDLTLEVAGGRPKSRRRADRPPLDRPAPRAVPAGRPQRLDARARRRARRDGDLRGGPRTARVAPERARA